MNFFKAIFNFFVELIAWSRVFIMMIFSLNFYRYLWSLMKDMRNMYYRYKV